MCLIAVSCGWAFVHEAVSLSNDITSLCSQQNEMSGPEIVSGEGSQSGATLAHGVLMLARAPQAGAGIKRG